MGSGSGGDVSDWILCRWGDGYVLCFEVFEDLLIVADDLRECLDDLKLE